MDYILLWCIASPRLQLYSVIYHARACQAAMLLLKATASLSSMEVLTFFGLGSLLGSLWRC